MPAIPEIRLLYKNFAGDQADQIGAGERPESTETARLKVCSYSWFWSIAAGRFFTSTCRELAHRID